MQSQSIIDGAVRLGHAALEFGSTAEFRREVLSQLESTFRSPTSVFLDWEHVGDGSRSWIENDMHFPHWDAQYRRQYLQRMRHFDPLFHWLDSGRFIQSDSVTRLTNLIDLKDFNRTPMYTDFLAPLKCQYILTLALNCGPDLVANVSLLRPAGDRDFDIADMQAARLAAPMLCGAYKRLQYKELLSEKCDLVNVIADMPRGQAWLLLSESMEPVYISAPLQKMVHGMIDDEAEAIRDILVSSATVRKYLRHFDNRSPASRRHLPAKLADTLQLPDGSPVKIEMCGQRTAGGAHYLRVLFQRIDTGLATRDAPRKSLLSMREIQIAQMISEGHTSSQIGETLCISPWTVKNHLKNIYAKLGVNNHVALARWLNTAQ